MNLSQRLAMGATALAAVVLSVSFGLEWSWAWAGIFLSLGGFLVYATWRGWDWTLPAGLVSWVGSAALGLQGGQPPLPMLVVVASALAAWDLYRFGRLRSRVKATPAASALEKRRLVLLGGVLGGGLLISGFTFFFQLSAGFGVMALLTLLLGLALSRAIRYLKSVGTAQNL